MEPAEFVVLLIFVLGLLAWGLQWRGNLRRIEWLEGKLGYTEDQLMTSEARRENYRHGLEEVVKVAYQATQPVGVEGDEADPVALKQAHGNVLKTAQEFLGLDPVEFGDLLKSIPAPPRVKKQFASGSAPTALVHQDPETFGRPT